MHDFQTSSYSDDERKGSLGKKSFQTIDILLFVSFITNLRLYAWLAKISWDLNV